MGDEHRPGEAGGVDGERLRVDEAGTVHRVDAEARPREVGEREAGHDLERDVAACLRLAQQRDRALRDRRAAGDGVADLPCSLAAATSSSAIVAVEVVEAVGRVVAVVERDELEPVLRELVDRRVARRPHVPVR